MKNRKLGKTSVLSLVAIIIVAAYQYFETDSVRPTVTDRGSVASQGREAPATWSAGQWVTVEGAVTRSLRDDNEGSRHQRFIIRLRDDRTLLVAHNIDLAKRIPLAVGDQVRLRGRYETNNRGGVVHWTHHDPDGRTPGGWVEFNGRRYR